MKKISSVLFTCIIAIAAWLVGGLLCADYGNPTFYYMGGMAFGAITIIAVSVADVLLKSQNRAGVEVNALPVVISFSYMFLSLVFNIVFMVKKQGVHGRELIAINVLLLLGFILSIYFASGYRDRVSAQVELTAAKTVNTTEIVSLAARLLSQADDEDIKKRLYKFKEKLDYSSNISQEFTVDSEEKLMELLRNIGRELSDGASKEQILSDIDSAEKIWSMRTAKTASIR